jgi:hypothetical protein
MSEGKLVKINHVRTRKVKNLTRSLSLLEGWLSESHTVFIPFMLRVHVIGYQQKAGEGAKDKAKHEADSLRAIRRYLMGELSCGGGGKVSSVWAIGIAFTRN